MLTRKCFCRHSLDNTLKWRRGPLNIIFKHGILSWVRWTTNQRMKEKNTISVSSDFVLFIFLTIWHKKLNFSYATNRFLHTKLIKTRKKTHQKNFSRFHLTQMNAMCERDQNCFFSVGMSWVSEVRWNESWTSIICSRSIIGVKANLVSGRNLSQQFVHIEMWGMFCCYFNNIMRPVCSTCR